MEEIRKQVTRARRRMVLEQFLTILPWSLSAALLAALLAIAAPKVWALGLLSQSEAAQWWTWGWLGGCALAGVIVAGVWTWIIRRGEMQAAIELDRRYGLKERVSSALSLDERDLDSEFGRALVRDAVRRVGGVDVREQFRLGVGWRALLPLLPAGLAFVLAVFVPYAATDQSMMATESPVHEREQTKKSIADLKKKLSQSRKIAESKGLEDAQVHLKELLERLDKLEGEADKLDRKETLIKLNDIKKDLDARRRKLGSGDEMRKQMNRLKDVRRGPADRVAKAMQDGEFKQALEEIKQLQQKLRDGELTEQEQKDLAQQLEQMQQKLEEAVAKHEQEKAQLQQRIEQLEQKQNNGGLNQQEKQELEKSRQQLDNLRQRDQQMQSMNQMAQQLGECSDCLGEKGDGQAAADKLDQLADQLQGMQQELDELETLDDVMNQIADAKNAMACEHCQGQGCEHCQGQGAGDKQEQQGKQGQPGGQQGGLKPGVGVGRGAAPPEDNLESGEFLSRVRGGVQAGEAIRRGDADGPNAPGVTRESVKAEIRAAMSRDVDPLSNERIPRDQRDHAREYFERYRTGK